MGYYLTGRAFVRYPRLSNGDMRLLAYMAHRADDRHANLPPDHENYPPRCTLTVAELTELAFGIEWDNLTAAERKAARERIGSALRRLAAAGAIETRAAERGGRVHLLSGLALTDDDYALVQRALTEQSARQAEPVRTPRTRAGP